MRLAVACRLDRNRSTCACGGTHDICSDGEVLACYLIADLVLSISRYRPTFVIDFGKPGVVTARVRCGGIAHAELGDRGGSDVAVARVFEQICHRGVGNRSCIASTSVDGALPGSVDHLVRAALLVFNLESKVLL